MASVGICLKLISTVCSWSKTVQSYNGPQISIILTAVRPHFPLLVNVSALDPQFDSHTAQRHLFVRTSQQRLLTLVIQNPLASQRTKIGPLKLINIHEPPCETSLFRFLLVRFSFAASISWYTPPQRFIYFLVLIHHGIDLEQV